MSRSDQIVRTNCIFLLDLYKKTSLSQDPFAETIAEVLEAIIEAAPVAVATGGTVAAAAVIANPPLPLTLASGVPPGIFFSNYSLFIFKCHNLCIWQFYDHFWSFFLAIA